MTIDQKCVLALAHRAHPKQRLEHLTDGEREALAGLWDAHGETLGPDFASAFDAFWQAHTARLDALKATVDDTATEEVAADE